VSEYTLKITNDQAKEMPMVDVAFHILKAANKTFFYRELMDEVAKVKGIQGEEILDKIAQLYTEINIDGRFACVGKNEWGLKRWYPVDKGDDAVGGAGRPRIINDDDDDLDAEIDEDLYEDDFTDANFGATFNGDDEPEDAAEEVLEDTLVEDIEEGVIVDLGEGDDEFDDEDGDDEDALDGSDEEDEDEL
jgi:DNA-directed RNA polymerase subunit delta